MRIAVDYQSVAGKKTGIGVAAESLVGEMRLQASDYDFLLYTPRNQSRDLRVPERIAWESLEIPSRARRDKVDAIYSPGFAPAMWADRPRIVTVHDLIGMIYPNHLPPATKFYWSVWLPNAIKSAHRLIASSESTKRDIVERLRVSEDRVRVVPLGLHARYASFPTKEFILKNRAHYQVGRPFWILVGTIESRKNLRNALSAFAKFVARFPAGPDLWIVGKAGGAEGLVGRQIASLGLSERVRLAGYVPDEDLHALYCLSEGFLFPSLYEGFGFPALEAMACEKTGIVSRVSSLPEIGGDCVLYCDPKNIDSIADQMSILWSDEMRKDKLARAARQRALTYSWSKAASSMIDIFRGNL